MKPRFKPFSLKSQWIWFAALLFLCAASHLAAQSRHTISGLTVDTGALENLGIWVNDTPNAQCSGPRRQIYSGSYDFDGCRGYVYELGINFSSTHEGWRNGYDYFYLNSWNPHDGEINHHATWSLSNGGNSCWLNDDWNTFDFYTELRGGDTFYLFFDSLDGFYNQNIGGYIDSVYVYGIADRHGEIVFNYDDFGVVANADLEVFTNPDWRIVGDTLGWGIDDSSGYASIYSGASARGGYLTLEVANLDYHGGECYIQNAVRVYNLGSMSFSPAKLGVGPGAHFKATATVSNPGSFPNGINWSVTGPASVDQDGVITSGGGGGSVKVKASDSSLNYIEEDLPLAYPQIILSPPSLVVNVRPNQVSYAQSFLTDGSVFPNGYKWKIVGDTLGCSIDETGGMITSGNTAGTITVQAYDDNDNYIETTLVLDSSPTVTYSSIPSLRNVGDSADMFERLSQMWGVPHSSLLSGIIGSADAPWCNSRVWNKCIDVTIDFGVADFFGTASGNLQINELTPSPELATPAKLQFLTTCTAVTVINNNSMLAQVKTPSALANVQVVNSRKYTVSLYLPTQVGTRTGDGPFPVSGDPYSVWTFENPDSNGQINHFRVTETRDGKNVVSDYTWVDANQEWTLVKLGGKRQEVRINGWDATDTQHNKIDVLHTNTYIIKDGNNAVVYKKAETYYQFPPPFGEKLIRQVIGDSTTVPITNWWIYYTNSATGGDGGYYGLLKQMTNSIGYWEAYDYDQYGRQTKIVSQCLNNAPQPTTGDPNNYITTIAYQGADPQVTTVTTWKGSEIGRTYQIKHEGETRVIQCQTPGAAVDAADNLVSITNTFTDGPYKSQLQRTIAPNGVVTTFQYATSYDGSQLTSTVSTGQADSNYAVTNGTRVVLVTNQRGQPVFRTTTDITSGIVIAREIYSDFDGFGRPCKTTFLDGTYTTTTYNCCGIESFTDRDGSITSYGYDDLKQLVSTAKIFPVGAPSGITTIQKYDAAGNVISMVRQGAVSTTYGTSGAGMQITLSSAVYDTAGRITSVTNAMGDTTFYKYGFDSIGQSVITNLFPDGSLRIEIHAKDGTLVSVTGTAVYPVRYSYDLESGIRIQKTIKMSTNGSDLAEWTKTYTDLVGRQFQTTYADNALGRSYYNAKGQLVKDVDPDGVTTLYEYNGLGQLEYTTIDMDRDGLRGSGGSDRITRVVSDVINNYGTAVLRTRTFVWSDLNSPVSNLVSTIETSVDGLHSWQSSFGITNRTDTSILRNKGTRSVVMTGPDGTVTAQKYSYGYLISTSATDTNGISVSRSSYSYDNHGRVNTFDDGAHGVISYSYNNADVAVTSINTAGPLTNSFTYDKMGRVLVATLPDGGCVTNQYYLTGDLKLTTGTRTYPVQYAYDAQGRVKMMVTWTNLTGGLGAATNLWNYDTSRGFMVSKRDASGKGADYTYFASGRTKTRSWARGTPQVKTTYGYDPAGNLLTRTYSDTTNTVSYSYDRLGQPTSVATATAPYSYFKTNIVYMINPTTHLVVTNPTTHLPVIASTTVVWTNVPAQILDKCDLAYNGSGQVLSETYSAGPLSGLKVVSAYDALQRRRNVTLLQNSSQVWRQLATNAFGYDAASRLQSVSDGTNRVDYSYRPGSGLISQAAFSQNNVVRLTTAMRPDMLGRQNTVIHSPGLGTPIGYGFQYDAASQRTTIMQTDGTRWQYQYDTLGQVTSAKKYWNSTDASLVAGEQFEYAYDDIGNRRTTKAGGNASGGGLRVANYAPNALNQYTNRSVPGGFDITGSADPNATVTVNNATTVRHDAYFWAGLAVDNTGGAVNQPVTSKAVLNGQTSSQSGNVFVPKTPETYAYDADGNLLSDGRWTYTWDGENRLITMVASANLPSALRSKLEFNYDPLGRRVSKKVSALSGTNYNLVSQIQYVYDGCNVLAELSSVNNNLLRSYMWGLDLSGTAGGAGGVGGLAAMKATNTWFVATDGSGNVAALVNSTNGAVAAQYEYSPYGELIKAYSPGGVGTNGLAFFNPFRFSTKYADDETDFLYYGYRFYNPSTGRWLSRDPHEEEGGVNLYGFGPNSPINGYDHSGLRWAIFESETYRRLAKDFFMGDAQAAPLDPFSYQAQLNREGAGRTVLRNADGTMVFGGDAVWTIGETVPSAVVETATFVGPGEIKGAYWAADAALAARSAGLLARLREGMMCYKTAGANATKIIDALMIGRRGGQIVSAARLDSLEVILAKHNVELVRDADAFLDSKKAGALFRAYESGKGQLFLRSDATMYELYHELKHFGDFSRLGWQGYFEMRGLPNEVSVFKYMMRQNWLSPAESEHAIKYILERMGQVP